MTQSASGGSIDASAAGNKARDTSGARGPSSLVNDAAAANERIPTRVFDDHDALAREVAHRIADVMRARAAAGERCVLGLATGSTPIGVYRELARMHKDEGLDLSRVITFNLDEYWPMTPESAHSYHSFMWGHLFHHINIRPENVHIPSGQWKLDEVERDCEKYEQLIRAAGGLDLQLLGIGRDGHIGFNEPGSDRNSQTRLVALDPMTRRDAASEFGGEEKVPTRAITMELVGERLSSRTWTTSGTRVP